MSIKISILSLAKYNNGLFKSESQSNFLTTILKKKEGYLGINDYNGYKIIVNWDDAGITEIIEYGENKAGASVKKIKFQRKIKGVLREQDIKRIAKLKRKIKQLQKGIDKRIKTFESGQYNRSGDVSTYTDDMIEMNNHFLAEDKKHIEDLILLIKEIEED